MSASAKLFYFMSLDLGCLIFPECISPRPRAAAAVAESTKVQTCGLSFEKCFKTPITVLSLTFTGLLELYMQVLLLSDITEEEEFYYMIDYIKTLLIINP